MKSALFFIIAAVVFAGCGDSNSDLFSVQHINISFGRVPAGTSESIGVTIRISATKTGEGYVSDPFSCVVSLPRGAVYTPGSSLIVNQPLRAPDAVTACPDGRTALVYDFQAGEISDPYRFKKFSTAILFAATMSSQANEELVSAAASETPFADPCAVEPQESVRVRVVG